CSSDLCFLPDPLALLLEDVYGYWRELRRLPVGGSDPAVSHDVLPASKHLERGVAIVDLLDAGISGRSARRWKAKIDAGMEAGLSRVAAATPRRSEEHTS